ncbi:hypothetical protein JMN32_20740 [Fulvivirga sp. 29W222]|uniref:Uncharacterized protein n=1 Tax=Fulvivirga marina TaxID=2494733 RepID=A0A937G1B8_9BACT|nr:hypothetical protein [Fulvivirga marina]MBL6448752.1 hypothetical protein [Fulvivirga marina]
MEKFFILGFLVLAKVNTSRNGNQQLENYESRAIELSAIKQRKDKHFRSFFIKKDEGI